LLLPHLPARRCWQVWLMLSDGERKQLTKLKQDLQEVRAMTTDMYGLGQAVGGSLLQGERQHACSCSAAGVPEFPTCPDWYLELSRQAGSSKSSKAAQMVCQSLQMYYEGVTCYNSKESAKNSVVAAGSKCCRSADGTVFLPLLLQACSRSSAPR
jgi:hypothetical protein